MTRLSLSDADKQARDWFVQCTRQLGCHVTVDTMGNIFAVRPGRKDGFPTCVGSHLDTQPTGGRYDGILGVCAGVEMLRVLNENKIKTNFPVGVVNWTNEEGARFPVSMISSGVWAGEIPVDDAHDLVEVGGGGKTMKDELRRIGYLGTVPASYRSIPIGAHFELHIEQGPMLERQAKKIGIVTGVQAYEWSSCVVTGRACHTGTTPFEARADALVAAARLVQVSQEVAAEKRGLASTGVFQAFPGSVNTVPGEVRFTLDIRAPTDELLSEIRASIKRSWDHILDSHQGVSADMNTTFVSKAIRFNDDCIGCVRESARANFGDAYCEITSGAGHDSVFTSKRVPTSMIFIPCKNGISHHPEEYSSPEDCANGAQVLLESVLRYDEIRQSQVMPEGRLAQEKIGR